MTRNVQRRLVNQQLGLTFDNNKFNTYRNGLRDDYHFIPIAVKTFGTWVSIIHKFITNIDRTISGSTKNPRLTSFIFQAISMAVQLGNGKCVQGKQFFRTCNVLPFSCTHLALRQGKRRRCSAPQFFDCTVLLNVKPNFSPYF